MQVQLKQSELVVAVHLYLTQQGINLQGKDVDVSFSATRSAETGMLTMVNIEDADLPAITPNVRPALNVVQQIAVKPSDLELNKTDELPGGVFQEKPAATGEVEKKITSLFNS